MKNNLKIFMGVILFSSVLLGVPSRLMATQCANPCKEWNGGACDIDKGDGIQCADCKECSSGVCSAKDSRDTGGNVNGDCGYCNECSGGACASDSDMCVATPCKKCDTSTGACTVTDDTQDTSGSLDQACGFCKKCSSGACVNDDDDGTPGADPYECGVDCKRCSGGSCQNDDTQGNIDDDCGSCSFCDSGICEDIEVTASTVTGPTGDHCIDDTETVTATTNYELDSGCSIEWSGDATFGSTTSTTTSHSATATLGTTGTPLTVKAKTSGQSTEITQTGTFSVVKVDEIKINNTGTTWTDVTGGSIVVLRGSKYNFKAIPDPSGGTYPTLQPEWKWGTTDKGTGSPNLITFDTVGTNTLTAKCCNGTGKTVSVQVVAPTVTEVGFDGDYPSLYKTPSANNGWANPGTGVDPISDPVYTSSTNLPVCVSKSANAISLYKVKLETSVALSYPTDIVVDASGTEEWNDSTTSVTITGTTSTLATLAITGTMHDKIKKYDNNFTIDWKYKVPSGTNANIDINTTTHTVYLTWDTPGIIAPDKVTEKRLNAVVEACEALTTDSAVCDGLWTDVVLIAQYSASSTPSLDWLMLDTLASPRIKGSCKDISRLFMRCALMIGLKPASAGGCFEITYCFPDLNGESFEDPDFNAIKTRNCTSGNNGHTASVGSTHDDELTVEKLNFIDGSGVGNNWECCFKYSGTPSKWYAPGTYKEDPPGTVVCDGTFTSVQGVMDAIVDYTIWLYKLSSGAWVHCEEPGPEKEHEW